LVSMHFSTPRVLVFEELKMEKYSEQNQILNDLIKKMVYTMRAGDYGLVTARMAESETLS
jgi:hypothetical protein